MCTRLNISSSRGKWVCSWVVTAVCVMGPGSAAVLPDGFSVSSMMRSSSSTRKVTSHATLETVSKQKQKDAENYQRCCWPGSSITLEISLQRGQEVPSGALENCLRSIIFNPMHVPSLTMSSQLSLVIRVPSACSLTRVYSLSRILVCPGRSLCIISRMSWNF